MVSAQDLISLYVGVELQSLSAYVLAAWRRDDARSSEAGLKYFVLSAISSGLLLFGASFVYGFTGSVSFDAIAAAIGEGAGGVGLLFGIVLMLCALGFKMSAAPFHMWTPDVYEGAPTPVTAFFAAAPKVAAVALDGACALRAVRGARGAMAASRHRAGGDLDALGLVRRAFANQSQAADGVFLDRQYGLCADGAWRAGSGRGRPRRCFIWRFICRPISAFSRSSWRCAAMARRPRPSPIWRAWRSAGPGWRGCLQYCCFPSPAFRRSRVSSASCWCSARRLTRTWFGSRSSAGVAAVVAAAYYLRLLASIWFSPPAPQFQPAGLSVVLAASLGAALSFPVLVLALGALQAWAEAAVGNEFLRRRAP